MKERIVSCLLSILLLPNELFSVSAFSYLLKAGLLAIIVVHIRRKTIIPFGKKYGTAFLVLIALVVVGILRSQNPLGSFFGNAFKAFYFVGYLYTMYLLFQNYMASGRRFEFILYSLLLLPSYIFFILNFAMWILNWYPIAVISEIGLGKSLFLRLIGIDSQRVEFPLSGGFNNYASHVCLILCLTLCLLVSRDVGKLRRPLMIGGMICLFTLLLIDSRSSIVLPILLYLAFKFTTINLRSLIMRLCIILIVLGPILLSILLPNLSTLSFFSNLARSDTDFATANGRLIIWGIILADLAKVKFNHLIGYGDFGHFGSGLSVQWESIFTSFSNSELKTPHNTMFSIILDYGYIGLFFYLAQFVALLQIHKNTKNAILRNVAFTIVFYNSVSGLTETLFGFYFNNYIFILLTLVLYMILISSLNSKAKNIAPVALKN